MHVHNSPPSPPSPTPQPTHTHTILLFVKKPTPFYHHIFPFSQHTHTLYTDLNARPTPPSNVVFEVRGQSASPLISARWHVSNCAGNFNCTKVLGYVVTCRPESTGEELRKTVWQSEVEDVTVAMTTVNATPYTRYACYMDAFNSYGFGFAGSIITVETPESGEEIRFSLSCV